MTAGVQNLEPAAYLPPPPSTSASDAKGAGTPDTTDFQSELEMQQTDPKETKPGGRAEKGSGKPSKKRDTPKEEPTPRAAVPVQVTEPQKQILPITLALPKPETNADQDVPAEPQAENAQVEQHTELPAQPQNVAPQDTKQPRLSLLDRPHPAKPPHPAKLRWTSDVERPSKHRQFSERAQSSEPRPSAPVPQATEVPQPAEVSQPATEAPNLDAAPAATPDSPKIDILQLVPAAPVPQEAIKSEDQATSSSESQPASRDVLEIPDAAPQEPVATAVKEETDSAPSSPSALAFAARLAVVAPKAQQSDEPVQQTPSQPPAVSDAPTRVRVPVRYTPTAQILRNDGESLKKDSSAFIDRPARIEARTEIEARTDMVLPRPESAHAAPPSPRTVAPPYAEPSARMDRVIDPPAAAPTSARDIRVQVPDNNGGSTQVRFVESGGEVRVSVRTADAGLAQNLRVHLNDLNQRLADGGIPAEFWKPAASAASSQNDQQQPNREGRGPGGQESGGHGEPQDRRDKRPAWLEEMEASLQGAEN